MGPPQTRRADNSSSNSPRPAGSFLLGLLPPAFLLLHLAWAGTLPAVRWVEHGVVFASVLVAALWAAPALADPLRLGRWGWLLPTALGLSVVASWAISDVPGAGTVGVAMLPLFLLLLATIERCWQAAGVRRLGLLATALAPGVLGSWALVSMIRFEDPRAAMPLGHHNLLALVLVALLPLVLLAWQAGGAWRVMAFSSGTVGLFTLVMTGSLAGGLGILAAALYLVLAASRRSQIVDRRRFITGALILAVGTSLVFGGRLVRVVSGQDSSTSARMTYAEAALGGIAEQLLAGHGPGSSAWTLADTMRPVPGVNPPGEVVSDPHSVPLQVLYEVGLRGFAVALALLVAWARARRKDLEAADELERWQAAALDAGLVGWAVTATGGASPAIPAVPMSLCFLLGARQSISANRLRTWSPGGMSHVVLLALLVAAAAVVVPRLDGTRHFDRARLASSPAEALSALEQAQRRDPDHPLYAFHRARLLAIAAPTASDPRTEDGAAVEEAFRAARLGVGLAPLWLQAGSLAAEADDGRAATGLERACSLDPLGALAPFFAARHAAVADRGDEARSLTVGLMARALAAEPRLAAAPASLEFLADAAQRARVKVLLERNVGLPRGLVVELGAALEQVAAFGDESSPAAVGSPEMNSGLAQTLDTEDATALSLHAFRRGRWPAQIAVVPFDTRILPLVDLPSAARLPETGAGSFSVACPGSPWAE